MDLVIAGRVFADVIYIDVCGHDRTAVAYTRLVAVFQERRFSSSRPIIAALLLLFYAAFASTFKTRCGSAAHSLFVPVS